MGSHKIKNKLHIFLVPEGRTGGTVTGKAKQNQNSTVWGPLSDFRNSCMTLWVPGEHTACLLDSGWLYPTASASLGRYPMVGTPPKFWGLDCNCTAPTNSFPVSPGTLTLLHGAKLQLLCIIPSVLGLLLQLRLMVSRVLAWFLMVPNFSCSPWPLHVFQPQFGPTGESYLGEIQDKGGGREHILESVQSPPAEGAHSVLTFAHLK